MNKYIVFPYYKIFLKFPLSEILYENADQGKNPNEGCGGRKCMSFQVIQQQNSYWMDFFQEYTDRSDVPTDLLNVIRSVNDRFSETSEHKKV